MAVTPTPVAQTTIELDVTGMTCASCAARIEKRLNRLDGVEATVRAVQVDANTIYKTDAGSTYYAHWEITEVFSVTVPVTLPLIVDEGGEVHVGAAEIINASTGDVIVSSVSISTKNGWQLVPYTTDMAHAKVDAKQLGFKINDSVTTKTGDAETFSLTSPWTIAENGKLPLSYDAVVSAVSQPVTEQDVLSVVFVLEWKGE